MEMPMEASLITVAKTIIAALTLVTVIQLLWLL